MLGFMLTLLFSAHAATLTAGRSGAADYPRVQDAVDAASHGDTILISAGADVACVDLGGLDLTLRGQAGPQLVPVSPRLRRSSLSQVLAACRAG